MSTRITFHDGIGSIGGTKITLTADGTTILFDFGFSFDPAGGPWHGPIAARPGAAGLRDRIALGELPRLDGLYRPEEAQTVGLNGAGEAPSPHVFISHLHLDHMAALDYLDPRVPVYFSPDSLQLLEAVATTGERPGVPGGARALPPYQPHQVGPFTITFVPVDHDAPGAVAMLIDTPDGTVVYSGDLRLHGAHPELTEQFMAAAQAKQPKILLLEGTRLMENEPEGGWSTVATEASVAEKVAEHLAAYPGLALITLYNRHPERVGRIAAAARAAGRRLLLSPATAHVFQQMGGDLRTVGIYRSARAEAMVNEPAGLWLKRLLAEAPLVLDAAAVRQAPGQYLLELQPADLPELNDLTPPPGSCFIHAGGEPLGPFDPAWAFFLRWLERYQITLVRAGSSGHATPPDLHRIASTIAPAILIPIHSRCPERLDPPGLRRILPANGLSYDLAEL
jgi:ribonuclease J